jgi:hypothetical protein
MRTSMNLDEGSAGKMILCKDIFRHPLVNYIISMVDKSNHSLNCNLDKLLID